MKEAVKGNARIREYLLLDYKFLQDYQILESIGLNSDEFIARITNTSQKVRFQKKKFDCQQFVRFEALHKLFKNGIILADNIFILEECDQLYFYIIEAYVEPTNFRFQTLQQYLQTQIHPSNKSLIAQIKVLIDCLHQQGQPYAGLTTANIIIDDEAQVYLTPFSLNFSLQPDNFQRAYYPPEIVQNISENKFQVTEKMMFKWDIWSFGCISLQILAYQSPIFLATSSKKQLKIIYEQFYERQLLQIQDNSIKNLIRNSLYLNDQYRNISIDKLDLLNQQKTIQINYHKMQEEKNNRDQSPKILTLKSENQILKSNKKALGNNEISNGIRELNLHQNQEEGDSELTLNLFRLKNVKFEKQLHISVHLNRKYHFYIDFDENNSGAIKLNRKITFKANFTDFIKMLSIPIVIELQEGQNNAQIQVNLQTLIISYEGRRVWEQQLIGTYTTKQHQGNFKEAKIKISCDLKSPSLPAYEQEDDQKSIFQTKSKEQTKKQILSEEKCHQKNNLKEIRSKNKKQSPSILQITENLSNLTEHWKRKVNIELEQKSDVNLQDRIQSLLQMI